MSELNTTDTAATSDVFVKKNQLLKLHPAMTSSKFGQIKKTNSGTINFHALEILQQEKLISGPDRPDQTWRQSGR